MSAGSRLKTARASLALGAVARAAVAGVAAYGALLALGSGAEWIFGLPLGLRFSFVAIRTVAAVMAMGIVLWRAKGVAHERDVALWLEERVPVLRYVLVTAIEPRFAPMMPDLERAIAPVRWNGAIARAVARGLAIPAAVAIASLLVIAALPDAAVARARAPRAGDAAVRVGPGAPPNLLAPLSATVTPPAYAHERRITIEEPSTISALAGSDVTLEGHGAGSAISASDSAHAWRVTGEGDRWRLGLRVSAQPSVIRLSDGTHSRLVVVEPRADSAPRVTLRAPARDTIVRVARGIMPLVADASDDIGLAAAWLEYIVSSGEGESFTFRSGVVARTRLSGARSIVLRGALMLDALALKPGDIVHLRAVARDENTVSGPGLGVSETRTLRVPRKGEDDSVAVEAAPPPEADQSALSERMLIILADSLQRVRPKLTRGVVVNESQRIGADQARLRKRVADIIFIRLEGESSAEESRGSESRAKLSPEALLKAAEEATKSASAEGLDFEGGESPVVHINRPLLEAYNAMWEAGRELDGGEPGRALPHMRAALAAIQRARQAERIYLRGRPPSIVVDLAKVRLTGKLDRVGAAPRMPRASVDPAAARRVTRFDAALRLANADRAAAIDSLILLRVSALTSAPGLAASIADAVDALRGGRDATAALVRARRALLGEPRSVDSLPAWSGW